jgi:hypothetical protein
MEVSRAASASANEGVLSALSSRYCGRDGSASWTRQPFEQRRQAGEQADKNNRHRHVESDVKFGRKPRKVGLPGTQNFSDRIQK